MAAGDSKTERNSTTNYTQIVGPKTRTGGSSAVEDANGSKDSLETKDFTTITKSAKSSADFANVGFTVSFRIPLLGSFPINGKSCS